MPKIAISTSTFDESNLPVPLRGAAIKRNTFGRRLTEEEITELLADGVVGLLAGVEPLTAAVFDRAQDLRVIARVGTGLDNVDLEAAAAHSIEVVNTPDAPAPAVAEFTLGLMLAALRQIPAADRSVRAGWRDGSSGRLLGARTVGLIGGGRIGRRVAQLLAPFGSEVLIHDPALDSVDPPAILVGFDELLERSDVVSLHVPLTPSTRHLIGERELQQVPRDCVLVNVSRGGLVDEEALLKALKARRLSAAALDCFEEEPYSGPLLELDDVVLSPHIASAARETRERMEREAAEKLSRRLQALGLCETAGDDEELMAGEAHEAHGE